MVVNKQYLLFLKSFSFIIILLTSCGRPVDEFVEEYEPRFDSLRTRFRDIRNVILTHNLSSSDTVCTTKFVFERNLPDFNANFIMFQELFDPDIFNLEIRGTVIEDDHFRKIRTPELTYSDTSDFQFYFSAHEIMWGISYFGDYGYKIDGDIHILATKSHKKKAKWIKESFENRCKKMLEVKYLLVAKIDKVIEDKEDYDYFTITCYFVDIAAARIMSSFTIPKEFELDLSPETELVETRHDVTRTSGRWSRYGGYSGREKVVGHRYTTHVRYLNGDPKFNLEEEAEKYIEKYLSDLGIELK